MFKGYMNSVIKEVVKELEEMVDNMEKEDKLVMGFLIGIYKDITVNDKGLPRWGSKERVLDSRTVDIHNPDNDGTLCNVYLSEIEEQKERLGLEDIVVQYPIDPNGTRFEGLNRELLKLQGGDGLLEFSKDLMINQFQEVGDLLDGAIEGVKFKLDFDSIPEEERLMEKL